MRKWVSLCLFSVLIISINGCDLKNDDDFQIDIDEALYVNETKQINIVGSTGNMTFIYESSDDTVLTVSDTGLLTGIEVGEATITVKSSSGKIREKIIQVNPIVYVNRIQLELKNEGPIYAGVAYSYEVLFFPEFSINQKVTFQKSDPNVRIDEEEETITFIRAGEASIFLYLDDDWNIQTKLVVDVIYAEDSKVYDLLFVGNSLTKYTYDIPKMVKNMMIQDNSIVYVTYSTNYQYLDQHEINVQKLLKQYNFTHVILQEKSDGLITNYNRFYDSVIKYNSLIHTNGAKLVLYQTWAYNYANIDERTEMQEAISKGYFDVSTELNSMLSKVGDVFLYVYLNHKDINLYNDLNHPSLYGAYLSALVHYKTITGKKAVESKYIPEGISTETADILKQVVDLVLDNE